MPNPTEYARANLGRLVAQVARQWRRAVDLRLQPYGLTEATWLPMLRLARAPVPMRQKDLAASLGLDNSSVVRILDGLQAQGLIERREGDGDRRAKAIGLTEPGRALVARVEAASLEVREELFAGIDDREIEIAFRVLDRIGQKLAADRPDEKQAAREAVA